MSRSSLSRRSFLKASAAATAAASALALPASAQPVGANERLNIGLIGTGGRCRHLMQALAKIPNTRMTALCDVYEPHLEQAQKLADPAAATFRDYHQLLARKDVHAVLIASPDHWHVPMTVDAVAAGKDVYVEKPLTHALAEGRTVLEAHAKHKRVVQIGTQQRSMPHIRRARELVQQGLLGEVHKVHLTWNRNTDRVRKGPQNVDAMRLDWKRFLGNAPQQPFDDYRFRNWRWFWDFGNGILTDLMVHWIDVVHWVLALDHPLRAVTVGGNYISAGIWQTPDTIQTLLVYPGGVQIHFEGTFCNAHRGSMVTFMGTDATLYIDRGRFELTPEPRSKQPPQEQVLGTGPRGRDFYDRPDGELLHLQDWIDAIRNSRQPSATVQDGVRAAAAAHLGNQAFRGTGVAEWRD
jgi:predicted dehydrogenase